MLSGRSSVVGEVSESSESEKKIGVAFFSCGFDGSLGETFDNIDAMESPLAGRLLVCCFFVGLFTVTAVSAGSTAAGCGETFSESPVPVWEGFDAPGAAFVALADFSAKLPAFEDGLAVLSGEATATMDFDDGLAARTELTGSGLAWGFASACLPET